MPLAIAGVKLIVLPLSVTPLAEPLSCNRVSVSPSSPGAAVPMGVAAPCAIFCPA